MISQADYYSKNYVKLRKMVLEEKLLELNEISKEMMNCKDPVRYRKLNERLNITRSVIDNLRDDLGYTDYVSVVKNVANTVGGTILTMLTYKIAKHAVNGIWNLAKNKLFK